MKLKPKIKLRPKVIIRNILIILFVVIVIKIMTKEKIKKPETLSLIVNNENVTSKLEDKILIYSDIVFISFNDIQKNIDSTIYQEKETEYIITTSNKKVAKMELNKSEIEINGSTIDLKSQPFKNEEGKIYIPISELKNVYDMEFEYNEGSKCITIDYYSNSLKKAEVKKRLSVKEEPKNKSATLEKLEKGENVIYISEENGWCRIRTASGILGYVKNSKIANINTQREEFKENDTYNTEKYLEKDITNQNISTYTERSKIAEKLMEDAFNKNCKVIKIKYNKDNLEEFKRFKIEVAPVLKECGISIIW